MILDVPFIPDNDYAALLADCVGHIGSVHFSLSSPHMQDARQRLAEGDTALIIMGLNRLPDVGKYVLMNGRLHDPARYFDTDDLDRATDLLERLVDEAGLHGVIFADAYYLTVLASHRPDLAARLEAVPSINCMLDTPGKAFATLRMVEETGFRLPSRLVLDRSLNRNPKRLEAMSATMRRAYPETKIMLMANEGCLYQCPYKPAHDAHISLVNEGLCGERTFAMNRDFGCLRRMLTDPGSILASPFIRPEDMARYQRPVNGFKICGRNRGADFLKRTVTAYTEQQYTGNLLNLMDAMGDLSGHVSVPNDALPADFVDRVTACDKRCTACGWCAELIESVATWTDPGLENLA